MGDSITDWLKRLTGARPAPRPTPAPEPEQSAHEALPVIHMPRVIRQGSKGYIVHEVLLHTTATAPGWWKDKTAAEMMAEVRRWHVEERGWKREGYHGLIAPDGSWAEGRPFTMIGAHCAERNRGTLGFALVPVRTVDTRRVGRFEDYYTEAQRKTIRAKLRAVQAMTDLKWVTGHNDYAARTCPGFTVKTEEWV